jgi:hypothetical protein
MAKAKKHTRTDIDLMEVECALLLAHQGKDVIWSSAQESLQRLFDRFKENLPPTYKVNI